MTITAVSACVILPLIVTLTWAIWHAVRTRRAWHAGVAHRMSAVNELDGVRASYNALWGLDTIRVVRKIAALRQESTRPKMSPHFVVVLQPERLVMLHGARGDQGTTVITAAEFRSIKTAASGPSAYTTWFIECVVADKALLLPIRLSDPSSDFLNADYAWAKAEAAVIGSTLGPVRAGGLL